MICKTWWSQSRSTVFTVHNVNHFSFKQQFYVFPSVSHYSLNYFNGVKSERDIEGEAAHRSIIDFNLGANYISLFRCKLQIQFKNVCANYTCCRYRVNFGVTIDYTLAHKTAFLEMNRHNKKRSSDNGMASVIFYNKVFYKIPAKQP